MNKKERHGEEHITAGPRCAMIRGSMGTNPMNRREFTRLITVSGTGLWTAASNLPYLVMMPLEGTAHEYFDLSKTIPGEWEGLYTGYMHSAANGAGETRGTWRQPHTSLTFAPRGQHGSTMAYGFSFRWAKDLDGVRDLLYQGGGFDFRVVPGMVLPSDSPPASMERRPSLPRIRCSAGPPMAATSERNTGQRTSR